MDAERQAVLQSLIAGALRLAKAEIMVNVSLRTIL
jgi:hypothetical protein